MVTKGESFSIVIKSSENNSIKLGIDKDLTTLSDLSMKVECKKGQTFYKTNKLWNDAKDIYDSL